MYIKCYISSTIYQSERTQSILPRKQTYISVIFGSPCSLATLIVTGDCPYSEREIGQILASFSLSICKSIKEITGFASGSFDRDDEFRVLIQK